MRWEVWKIFFVPDAEAKNAVYSITSAELLHSDQGPDSVLNYKLIINLDTLC